jgi:cytochrome b561
MKVKVRNISFIAWLITIALFIVGLYSFQFLKDNNPWYQAVALAWFVDIGIGIVAFLVMIFTLLISGSTSKDVPKKTLRKTKSVSGATIAIIIVVILLILFGSGVLLKDYFATKQQLNELKNTQRQSPIQTNIITQYPTQPASNGTYTATVNNNPNIDCVGPDGKHFQTTKTECDQFNAAWGNTPTLDPNEYIKCNINPNCGGGYKEMTRSSCDQMTCCNTGSTWTLLSRGACDQAQKTSLGNLCQNMCSAWNGDSCKNYYQVGSTGMSECISNALSQEFTCVNDCLNGQ